MHVASEKFVPVKKKCFNNYTVLLEVTEKREREGLSKEYMI